MPRGNEGSDSNVVLWPSYDQDGDGYLSPSEYSAYIDAGGPNFASIPRITQAELDAIETETAAPSEADPIAQAEEAAPSEAVATNWYDEDSIAWWDVNDPAAYFGAVPNERTAEQTERANRFYDEWAGEGATNSRTAYGTLKGLVDGYYTPSQVDQYWGSSTAISEMSQVDAYSDTIGEYGGDGDEGGGFGDYLQQEWDNFNTSQGVDLGDLNTSPTSGTIVSDGPGGQAEIATAERLAMEAYQNAILAAAQESDIPVSVDSPDGAVYTLNYGQYDDVSLGEYKQTKEPDGFSVNDFVEMGVKMILSSVITGGISGLIKGLAAGTGAVAGAVDGVTGAIANLGSMAKNLVDLPDTIISFVTNPQEFLSNEIFRNLPDDGGIIFNLEEGSNAFQYYDALGETYRTVDHVLDTKDAIAGIGQIVALNDYIENAKGVDGVVPESVINNPATLMQVLNEGADSGLEVLAAQEEVAKTFAAAGYDASPEEIINNTSKTTDEIKTYVTQTDPFGDYVFYPSGAGPEEIAEVDARDAEISPMRKIARAILDQIEGIKLKVDPDSPEDQAGLSGLGKTLNWVQGVFDDYSDLYQNANAAALKAAGGILEGTAAVSVFWGENPLSTTKGALGRAMAGLGNDSYTPEFKLALKDIAQRTGKAVGIEGKAEAWYGAIKDHPLPFLVDTIGVEVGQEVVPFLIGGLASSGVKGAALFRGVSEELATSMGAKAGFKAGVVADLMESGLMSMGGAYEEALDSLLLPTTINPDTGNPYTQAEAEEAAQTIAITQGAVAIGTTAISMGLGGNALEAKVFKDKAPTGDELLKLTDDLVDIINPSASGAFRTYIKEVSTRLLADVKDVSEWAGAGAVEAVSEGSEELFQAAALENSLYTYGDKTRDYEGNLFENTLIGTIAGGGTSSVMAGSSFVSDALFNLNPEVNEVVNKGLAEIEAGADPSTVAKNIRESLNTFGIEDKSIQTDFANAVDNEGYTTREEAGAKFAEAGYEFTEEELAQYTGELNEANTLNNIETYVDPRQVTIDEAKAELIAQGITDPSDAEIAAYVGQGNGSFQSTQYGQIGTYADPRVVTEAEAKAELIAQGVANPTQAQIDAYKGEGDENFQSTQYGEIKTLGEATVAAAELEAAKEATKSTLIGLGYTPSQTEIDSLVGKTDAEIAAYVDPRVVTEAEAKAQLVAQGITNPTQDQINSFKGEGDENFQSIKNTEIQAYADPRVVTEAEAKAELIAQGISNPTQNEIDAYKGQGNENFQSTKNTEIQAYADPRVVTEAEVEAELIRLGIENPSGDLIEQYSGQGDETFQQGKYGELETYANPRVVTEAEAEAALIAQGLSAEDAKDLAKNYVGQGGEDFETTIKQDINDDIVTEQELIDSAVAAGLGTDYELTPEDRELIGVVDEGTTAADVLKTHTDDVFIPAVNVAEAAAAASETAEADWGPYVDDINRMLMRLGVDTNTWPAGQSLNIQGPDGPVDANGDGIYSPDELIAAGLTEEIGLNPDLFKTPTDDGEAAAEGETDDGEAAAAAAGGDTDTGDTDTGDTDTGDTDTGDTDTGEDITIEGDTDDYVRVGDFNIKVTALQDNVLAAIKGYEDAGLLRDEAIAKAVGVAKDPDTGKPTGLYEAIGGLATEAQVAALKKVVDGIANTLGTAPDGSTIAREVALIKDRINGLVTTEYLNTVRDDLFNKIRDELVGGVDENGDPISVEDIIKKAVGVPKDADGNPTGLYADVSKIDLALVGEGGIKDIVTDIQTNMLTDADLADLVTKDQLETAFTDNIGAPASEGTEATGIFKFVATKKDIADLKTDVVADIKALLYGEDAVEGLTLDEAIKAVVGVAKDADGNPTGLYKDLAGLDVDVDAVKTIVDNIQTNMLTDADLADLVTKTQLDTAFTNNIGNAEDGTGIYKYVATKTELTTLETNLIQRINDSLGATNADGTPKTIDQIIKEAVGVPADADGNPTGLYKDLAGIDITVDDIKTVVDGIATTLGTTASEVTAIKTALENNLGAPSVVDAEGNITTEATGVYDIIEGLATKTEVAAVETAILDKIKEYEDAGLTRDEALQKAIDQVATDLGTTKKDITDQITKFESDLATEIATLATKTQVSNVETAILDKIKEYEDAGLTRDEALQKAIDQVATDLGTTKEAITQQLTAFQTKLDADLSLLATKEQVNEFETELYLKIAEYEALGVERDIATQAAIQELATEMGTNQTALMEQMGLTETNLTTRINDVETNLTNQFDTTQQLITDTATKTQQQIDTTATETQKQVKTAANQSAARDFFDMVLGSEDLEGQQVTVSQSPLAQINYIYDFQDPLANQQQRGFFGAASPYGESLAAGKSRRPQTIANVMQGPLNLQGAPVGPMGMAAGGKVDYDFLNEISQIMSFGE